LLVKNAISRYLRFVVIHLNKCVYNLYYVIRYNIQYAIHFELRQNMQKYAKNKIAIIFKLLEFVKITDKNPKNLKRKKYAIP